jgi:hypothetical protein
MKRNGFLLVMLVSIGLWGQPLAALEAQAESVEIFLTLHSDGKAVVRHSIVWDVSSGTMGGFYFQGEQAPMVWDAERCWADLPNGTRTPLDIKNAGDKWDILLSQGKRTSGFSPWVLTYGADLAAANMVGLTDKSDGEKLFYFHWAPPQWEQPLDHRSVTVVFPLEAKAGESGDSRSERLAQLGFATEKHVNDENSIDWYAAEGSDGKSYLALRFHQRNPAAHATQDIQFYMSAENVGLAFSPLFDALAGQAGPANPSEALQSGEQPGDVGAEPSDAARSGSALGWQRTPLLALFLCGGIAALGVFLYRKKIAGYPKAVAKAEGIAWAGDSWTPPRLSEGTYAIPGKVAEDLHPVEVALLFELPLPRVVAVMIKILEDEGVVRLAQEAPLRLEVLKAESADEYGYTFLGAFDTEGWVLSGRMADFFETALKKLQEKTWDCDIEATRRTIGKKWKKPR